MDLETLLLVVSLIIGFYMTWNIGANDVANAIGTSVGSGALTLRRAVLLAAILEFGGAYFFGSEVSQTIQKGIVTPEVFMGQPLILVLGMMASLLAAGAWLQLASYFGWPVSTTHSIIGAVVGFGLVLGGVEAISWYQVGMIGLSWVTSPLLGAIGAYLVFSFLRRFIFYAIHPVLAAKRMVPLVVAMFAFILTSVLVFKGVGSVDAEPSWKFSLAVALSVALLGYLLSLIWMRFASLKVCKAENAAQLSPQVEVGLQKAIDHLQKIKLASSGQFQEQINIRMNELEMMSKQLDLQSDRAGHQEESRQVEKIFATLQMASASFMAFSHGANDVANAIGPLSVVVTILRESVVNLNAPIPSWMLAWGGLGIVIGLATWGWRVIETVGRKITELTPTRGFSAEFGCATTVMLASQFGIPISTTHTLVGSIFGVGIARGIGALNLSMIRDIIVSWLITIPAGAGLSVAFFYLLKWILIS